MDELTPTPVSGGGGAIDASNPDDMGAMRTAMIRWPRRFREITDERKKRWVEGLDIAQRVGEVAAVSEDAKERISGGGLIIDAVRTGVMMEALNQRDEHKAIDKSAPDKVIHEHRVFKVTFDRSG